MTDDIKQLNKMLRAILLSQNNLHWIGGYVYGETSRDDPYIILYPSSDRLKQKVVRVYPHGFKKLPAFVVVPSPDNWRGDTSENPDKDKARRKGIYHECPAFLITTWDGSETQMGREKRFGDVLRVSHAASRPQAEAQQQPPLRQQPPPPQPAARQRNGDALQSFVTWSYGRLKGQAKIDVFNGERDNVARLIGLISPNWTPDGTAETSRAMYKALELYQKVRANAPDPQSAPAHQVALASAIESYGHAKVKQA